MDNQAYIFFIFILNGFIIGILFDIFRILRKSFKTSDLITYIQDIIFWILSGVIILYSIFKFNNGMLRAFIFIGLIIGSLFYMLLFSKTFIKINVFIIKIVKTIVNYALIIPIKKVFGFLRSIIYKPSIFLFINLRKKMSNLKDKVKKIKKKCMFRKDLE